MDTYTGSKLFYNKCTVLSLFAKPWEKAEAWCPDRPKSVAQLRNWDIGQQFTSLHPVRSQVFFLLPRWMLSVFLKVSLWNVRGSHAGWIEISDHRCHHNPSSFNLGHPNQSHSVVAHVAKGINIFSVSAWKHWINIYHSQIITHSCGKSTRFLRHLLYTQYVLKVWFTKKTWLTCGHVNIPPILWNIISNPISAIYEDEKSLK